MPHQLTTKECIFYGALGGMCPTLAKLGGFYSTQLGAALPEPSVFMALGIFAVLGAIIALAFGDRQLKAAVVAGIAAPGLVTNIVAGAKHPRAQAAASVEASTPLSGLFSAAYAQTLTEGQGSNPVAERVLTLTPQLQGGLPENFDLPLRFRVQIDGEESEVPGGALTSVQGTQQLTIPQGATALIIANEEITLDDANPALDVEVRTAPTWRGDLLWALGGSRSYELEDVEVLPTR